MLRGTLLALLVLSQALWGAGVFSYWFFFLPSLHRPEILRTFRIKMSGPDGEVQKKIIWLKKFLDYWNSLQQALNLLQWSWQARLCTSWTCHALLLRQRPSGTPPSLQSGPGRQSCSSPMFQCWNQTRWELPDEDSVLKKPWCLL